MCIYFESYKVFMITKVTEGRVRELRSISNVLYNKLNDWIIESLKEENNFILTSVKTHIFNLIIHRSKHSKTSLQIKN